MRGRKHRALIFEIRDSARHQAELFSTMRRHSAMTKKICAAIGLPDSEWFFITNNNCFDSGCTDKKKKATFHDGNGGYYVKWRFVPHPKSSIGGFVLRNGRNGHFLQHKGMVKGGIGLRENLPLSWAVFRPTTFYVKNLFIADYAFLIPLLEGGK